MNLALLAKQGWRVVTRQASLLYKFSRDDTFVIRRFYAKVGTNPSVGWRMGDGKGINIWKDPWVPRKTDFYLRGQSAEGPRCVSQLIENGAWNANLIQDLLNSEDARLVLSIPLSRQRIRDRIVWNHTKSGMYTTSSGYLSERSMKKNGELGGACKWESSATSGRDKLWSGVKLRGKGVMMDDRCLLCDDTPETLEHLFLQCPVSRRMCYVNLERRGGWSRLFVSCGGGGGNIGASKCGEKQGTTGVIIRDNQGEFMGASFKIIPSVVQVIVAEAMAIREGLAFAIRQGWDHIDVESDSHILIKVILGEFLVPLEIHVVIGCNLSIHKEGIKQCGAYIRILELWFG
ncbi:hypothetical protein LIER_29366 [Lithospermum erythrorhizon]|uniref:RNase H type-1 domain-containing protein n=1 Tax=Lithospermum erythrorhizon TaxID=34254 RepID=A0AAV3RIW4_LITER